MGTRSGSLDPGLLLHLLREEGASVDGLDARAATTTPACAGSRASPATCARCSPRATRGDERARLAFDVYVHRLRFHLGAMLGALGGLDAVVFTAGVGEHSAEVRAAALEPFAFLGLALDGERNARAAARLRRRHGRRRRCACWSSRAREEWAIARAAAGVRLAGDAGHVGGWPHLKRAASEEVVMLVFFTARRLKPGAWEQFRRAWDPGDNPPPGFQRAYHARNIRDEDEVISFGLFDLTKDDFHNGAARPRSRSGRASGHLGVRGERARLRRLRGDRHRRPLMATPIILDCDPGHDDAVALLLAAGNDAIDLLAVTTVAGNCPLELATLNARRVAALAGLDGVPIAAGAAGPLQRRARHRAGHPRRDRPRRLRADHRRGAARPAQRDRADGRHARGGARAGHARPDRAADQRRAAALRAPRPARADPRDRADGRLDRPRQRHAGGRVQHLRRPRGGRDRVRERAAR